MKSGAAVPILIFIGITTLGVTLVFELPDTQNDALAAAEQQNTWNTYSWTTPDGDLESITLDINESDFKDSISSNVLRRATFFVPAPSGFITPDDPFVKQIADEILKVSGEDDYSKALAGLRFVQCAILYNSDTALYGQEEFWAYPVETLYLHSGDCEDASLLLTSIYLAMGLDAVLLDYPGHMAAGVKLDVPRGLAYALDDGCYCYCEAVGPQSDIGEALTGCNTEDVQIWKAGSFGVLNDSANGFLSGYRLFIQRILGI